MFICLLLLIGCGLCSTWLNVIQFSVPAMCICKDSIGSGANQLDRVRALRAAWIPCRWHCKYLLWEE